MSEDKTIRIRRLRCGTMQVSKETTEGGKSFFLPALHSLDPSARRIELPVYCYLIEHPKGLILVDTGWSRAVSPDGVYNRKAASAILGSALAEYYRPALPLGEALEERLAVLSLRPRDIDYLLITHPDVDHVCNLSALREVKRILMPEEEYWWSCRTVYKLRQKQELWLPYSPELFWYRGTGVGPFGRSFDLFGDESIHMIISSGHTDGMATVRIENRGRFAILCADAAYSSAGWSTLTPSGFGFNPKAQIKTLEWLREQARDSHCAGISASHGADTPDEIIL